MYVSVRSGIWIYTTVFDRALFHGNSFHNQFEVITSFIGTCICVVHTVGVCRCYSDRSRIGEAETYSVKLNNNKRTHFRVKWQTLLCNHQMPLILKFNLQKSTQLSRQITRHFYLNKKRSTRLSF